MQETVMKLINAINEYKNESLKKDYVFTSEEYKIIYREIDILENHLEMLAKYEDKR